MFDNFLKRTSWIDIIISMLFVILGILLMIKPSEMMSVIYILLGMMLFIMGFLKLVDYFTSKDKEDYLLTFALISTVLGVIVLCCSDVITGIFRIALGIWIIASGIRNFQTSLIWKEVKSGLWTITVLCALLMIIAGIVILVSRTLAIRIVGITIVIYAALDIITRTIFMKKIQDYINK